MFYKRFTSSLIIFSFLLIVASAAASDIFDAIKFKKTGALIAAVKKNPSKVNTPEKKGGALPLFAAINSGSTAAVEILLKHGADANMKNTVGVPALHYALQILKKPGAMARMMMPDNQVFLMEPAIKAVEMAKMLVPYSKNVNYVEESGETTLMLSTLSGDEDLVSRIIKNGADVNYCGKNGSNALYYAAFTAPADIVKLLLSKGADPNLKTITMPALIYMLRMNFIENTKALVEGGANVNICDETTGVSLLGAALWSYAAPELLKIIVKKGADVNFENKKNNMTILMTALELGTETENIKFLIERGADVNRAASNGRTPLMVAAAQKEKIENLKFLIESGAGINAMAKNGETALTSAIAAANDEAAAILKKKGAREDPEGGQGLNSALAGAALKKDVSEMRKLIEKCADVNMTLPEGGTLLYKCVNDGLTEEAKLLVEKGARILPEKPDAGYDALASAIWKRNEIMAVILIDKLKFSKDTVNAKNYFRYAIGDSCGAIVAKLIEKGIDAGMKIDGDTPLAFAAKCNAAPSVFDALLKAGAGVDARGDSDETALMAAVRWKHYAAADHLLSRGASVNLKTPDGKSALSLAVNMRDEDMTAKLKAAGAKYDHSDAAANAAMFLKAVGGNDTGESLLLLEKKGVNPDAVWPGGPPPLITAAENMNFPLIKALVEKGANIKVIYKCRPRSWTDGMYYYNVKAVEQNVLNAVLQNKVRASEKYPAVEYLLKTGAKVKKETLLGSDIIDSCSSLPLLKLLVENGLEADSTLYEGDTLIGAAAEAPLDNSISFPSNLRIPPDEIKKIKDKMICEIIDYLVKKGAGVNKKDKGGRTPLMRAVRDGECGPDVPEKLIKEGADVNAVDKTGSNVLFKCWSKYGPDISLFRMLVEAGADINLKNLEGGTVLQHAASYDRRDIMDYLISRGAKLEFKSKEEKRSFLYFYVRAGDEKMVEKILRSGFDPEILGSVYNPILFEAIDKKFEGVAKLLIDSGASLDHENGYIRRNALCAAISSGQKELARHIISRSGGKVKIPADALFEAAKNKDSEMINLLMNAGVAANARNDRGSNVLNSLCMNTYGFSKGICDILISAGADVNNADNEKRTPLMAAAMNHDPAIIEFLISKGAGVNASDSNKKTALAYAARANDVKSIAILKKAGAAADLNDAEFMGDMLKTEVLYGNAGEIKTLIEKGADMTAAFRAAVGSGKIDAVKIMIAKGYKVDFKKESYNTGFWEALGGGHLEVVKFFIDNGTSVDQTDSNGDALLISACKRGNYDIARYLIGKGADIKAVEKKTGNDLLMISVSARHDYEFIKFLIGLGFSPRAVNKNGRNALIAALMSNSRSEGCFAGIKDINPEVIELLLEKGADPNLKDKNNYYPLKIAKYLIKENLQKYSSAKYPADASTIAGILKKHGARE